MLDTVAVRPEVAMKGEHPSLDELLHDVALVPDVSAEAVPALLAEVSARQVALAAVTAALAPKLVPEQQRPDRLLTVDEAATRLAVSRDYLYRNSDELPFALRVGPGQLRFSERGIEKFLKTRRKTA